MTIDRKALSWIELVVLVGLVFLYGWATYERNFVWETGYSLWLDVTRKSPLKARPHQNLGVGFYNKGEYSQAIAEFKEAIYLDPYNPEPHYKLGVVYQRIGLFNLAISEYDKFLGFEQKHPRASYSSYLDTYVAKAYNNLGVCYFNKGEIDKAIEEFKKALRQDPYLSDALYNLGIATKKREQVD